MYHPWQACYKIDIKKVLESFADNHGTGSPKDAKRVLDALRKAIRGWCSDGEKAEVLTPSFCKAEGMLWTLRVVGHHNIDIYH